MKEDRLLIRSVAVDLVSEDEALAAIAGFLDDGPEDVSPANSRAEASENSLAKGAASGRSALIVTPNCEIAANALKKPELKAALESADLVIADGIGMYLSSKMLGRKLPARLAGIDLCYGALKLCAEKGKKVFLLGGKTCAPGLKGWAGGKSVAAVAADCLREQIPGLDICGTRDGYFTDEEEIGVVDQINESGADFLVAGLGSPKQELFLCRNLQDLCCKACMGVGGSLDVWSGSLKRAPEWMTRCGLEWLWRLGQEPKRISRIVKIPAFLGGVLLKR